MGCLLNKRPYPRLPWHQLLQLAIVAVGVLTISPILRTSAQTIEPSAIIIALPSDNEFYVNKVKVAREEIAAAVETLSRGLREEKRIIYIKAAVNVRYGTVVGIVNEMGVLGYRVGLVADKKKQPDTNAEPRPKTESDNQVGQGVAVPTNDAAASENLTVTVRLGRGNKMLVRVGSKPVTLRNVTSVVRATLKPRVVKNVRLVAPARSSYGAIAEIIDSIISGGGRPIGLQIN